MKTIRQHRSVLGLVVVLLCVVFSGCASPKVTTPEEFFKLFLNYDLQPNLVTNFAGRVNDQFPAFLSQGYAQYTADASLFEFLALHPVFSTESEFNQPIQSVSCEKFDEDFTYWTSEEFGLENKLCYTGVYDFYIHYIVFDPATGLVRHFIDGMRE